MVKRIKRGWMNLRVLEVVKETHDTVTIVLIDHDEGGRRFDYLAGQYLTFRFDSLASKPLVRSYTLSSSPCESEAIAFTVKEVEDGFVSKYLCKDVKAGDVLRARGPIGKFCFLPKTYNKNLTMIAAGSGVTPFVSIMREYKDCLGDISTPSSMDLLVSFRSRNDIILAKELDYFNSYSSIRVKTTLSREKCLDEGFLFGRISKEMVKSFVGKVDGKTFMLCGPDNMMEDLTAALQGLCVDPDHIIVESFAS